jgi:hypothetical protein
MRPTPTPSTQRPGDRWGQKNQQSANKKRKASGSFSSLPEGIGNAGNSLEKMIYQWGQMSNYDNLSPLIFDVRE